MTDPPLSPPPPLPPGTEGGMGGGIVLNSDGQIKAASFDRLIIALTDSSSSPTFRKSFLLSYRSFTTPVQLMQALEGRFCGVDGETEVEKTRLRIVGIVKAWLEDHFYDFLGDSELLRLFLAFVEKISKMLGGLGGGQLKKVGFFFSFFFSFFFYLSIFFQSPFIPFSLLIPLPLFPSSPLPLFPSSRCTANVSFENKKNVPLLKTKPLILTLSLLSWDFWVILILLCGEENR